MLSLHSIYIHTYNTICTLFFLPCHAPGFGLIRIATCGPCPAPFLSDVYCFAFNTYTATLTRIAMRTFINRICYLPPANCVCVCLSSSFTNRHQLNHGMRVWAKVRRRKIPTHARSDFLGKKNSSALTLARVVFPIRSLNKA